MMTLFKLLRGKIISNIFSFRGDSTLKPRSKFILKNLIFSQFKTKWSKIRVYAPLTSRTLLLFSQDHCSCELIFILLPHSHIPHAQSFDVFLPQSPCHVSGLYRKQSTSPRYYFLCKHFHKLNQLDA